MLDLGRVVDVRPAPGDPSIRQALEHLDPETRAALEAGPALGAPDAAWLTVGAELPREALGEVLRAVWVERLARGLREAEAAGGATPHVGPRDDAPTGPFAMPLKPLVLEAIARGGEAPPEVAITFPPARAAAVELDPGAARALPDTADFGRPLPSMAQLGRALEDPLVPIEREIERLEQGAGDASSRSAAWSRLAEAWRTRYGSVTERERALREAAAAAPRSVAVLLAAAEGCIAAAHDEDALAYARAAVGAAGDGPERDGALLEYTAVARALGRVGPATGGARAATLGTRSLDALDLLAALLEERGKAAEAADARLAQAARYEASSSERCRFLIATAWWTAPDHLAATEAYATLLAREGKAHAAVAVRADAARKARSVDARCAGWIAAAEHAEWLEEPLWAADFLLRALDTAPGLEVLHEPVDLDLRAAGAALERAIVLEEIARNAPRDGKAEAFERAADAWREQPGGDAWAEVLRTEATRGEAEPRGPDEGRARLASLASAMPAGAERAEAWLNLARWASAEGAHLDAGRACLAALEDAPAHREAALRLARAGVKQGEAAWIDRSLSCDAALPHDRRQQARNATARALRAEAEGDVGRACRAADEALQAYPLAAEAALVLVRGLEAGGHEASPGALAAATALLGDCPPLTAHRVQSAATADARMEVAVAWSGFCPAGQAPWVHALRAATRASCADGLCAALQAIVTPPRCHPGMVPLVVSALEHLAAMGDRARALEMSLVCGDRFGSAGAPIRALCVAFAAVDADVPGQIGAAERRLVGLDGEGSTAALRAVAALHASLDDDAAESRAWLRLLAGTPGDPEALDRLTTLYAACSERERLMATLALRLACARTDAQRLDARLAQAIASARVLGDLDAAEAMARAALGPVEPATGAGSNPDDPELDARTTVRVAGALVAIGRPEAALEVLQAHGERASGAAAGRLLEGAATVAAVHCGDVPRALDIITRALARLGGLAPLLLTFEHLCLERNEVDLAKRTYDALALDAMGPRGRAALLYRKARWLERAAVPRSALEAYLDAAKTASSAGAVLSAVTRLGAALKEREALPTALLSLADNAPHEASRVALRTRAAHAYDQLSQRPERAWEILFEMWLDGGPVELEAELGGLGARARALSSTHGESLFDALFTEMRRRADEAWMADGKARVLRRMARLQATARQDLQAAEVLAAEAIEIWQGEDPDPEAVEGMLADLASFRADAEARAAEAQRPASLPKADVENDRQASPPGRSWGPWLPSPVAVPAAADADDGPEDAPPTALPKARPVERWKPSIAPLRPQSTSPIAVPFPEPSGSPVLEASPRSSSKTTATPPPDPIARALRAQLAADPSRLDVLAQLEAHALARGAGAEVAVCQAVLSALDAGRGPAASTALRPDCMTELASARAELSAHAHLDRPRKLLAAVWEFALPLFRWTPTQAGVLGTDRVGLHAPTVHGRALAACLSAVPRPDTAVFATRLPGVHVAPLRIHPPAVILGAEAPDDERELRFWIGRALCLAEPEHILVSALPEGEGRALVSALAAAFGPAEGAPVSRDAAALAASLWRTIPARSQRELRDLVVACDEALDYDAVRRASLEAAAQAGLVCCGDLSIALSSLLTADPALAALDRDAAGFARAIEASPALNATLRLAFHDAFIDGLELTSNPE